jgi:hypothetical protein
MRHVRETSTTIFSNLIRVMIGSTGREECKSASMQRCCNEESGSRRTARRTTETHREIREKERGLVHTPTVDIKTRAGREWLESAAQMKTQTLAGVTHTHTSGSKRRNKCHTLMQPTICDGINDGSNNNDLRRPRLLFRFFGCFFKEIWQHVLVRLIVPFVTRGDLPKCCCGRRPFFFFCFNVPPPPPGDA